MNRRTFIRTSAAGAAGVAGGALWLSGCAAVRTAPRSERPKRVALLATEVRKHSHAQHFIDRLVEGYGWGGRWHRPSVQLASLYVDQFPENDLARERSSRFQIPIFSTIEEALTLGGRELQVDGVLIIGEHGRYPRNEKRQTLYPRYEWFKKTVGVFEASARAVPVFNDKHLSTKWAECVEMMSDARELGFAFLAGSSLPVTRRIPAVDVPLGAPMRESLCVCYGGVDSYDIHGLETAQCMSERRRGGESGVRTVQALRGAAMWDRVEQSETTRRLFLSALARSHMVRAPEGYSIVRPSVEWSRQASPEATGYFIEHNDGFRTVMVLCNGLVRDFTYAGLQTDGSVISCQMHLPMPGISATTADFFNPLVWHIEQMVKTGRAAYPAERTLLTSGMTLAGVESLFRGQSRLETPEMNVQYMAPEASTFWQV